MTKNDAILHLRKELRTMITCRATGALTSSYAKKQGYVDGYMQALMHAQIASEVELLQIVADERRKSSRSYSHDFSEISTDSRGLHNFA